MLLSNTIARTYSKYVNIKIVLLSIGLDLFHRSVNDKKINVWK